MAYLRTLRTIAGLGGYLAFQGLKLFLGGAVTILLSPVVALVLRKEDLDTLMEGESL